ncbi:18152_t:CDS:2, partial [Gigaspora rosea]
SQSNCKVYCEKQKNISNDATSLYEDLLKKKDEVLTVGCALMDDESANSYQWVQLIKKYNEPRVIKYLQMLYSSKHAWVRAYTAKVFTASIQTTSKVESYNAQIKRLVLNSNISLIELAKALETNISKESNKTKYLYWKTQIPLTSSVITLL